MQGIERRLALEKRLVEKHGGLVELDMVLSADARRESFNSNPRCICGNGNDHGVPVLNGRHQQDRLLLAA
ncbi:hypothetical protein D3C75_1337460 [compost metagenome]